MMEKIPLTQDDMDEIGDLYNSIVSSKLNKVEKVLKNHKITYYNIPNFDKVTVRIDIRSISKKPSNAEQQAALDDAKREMFGDDADLVSDDMGAQ